MNKFGPIIVIEDDVDDQEFLDVVFKRLAYPNDVVYFSDGEKAIAYLGTVETQPFLILSDINMPKINGFEVRNKIFADEELAFKCIPYLFFTTASSEQYVEQAYSMSVQGFFIKPASMAELEVTLTTIIEYWKISRSPGLKRVKAIKTAH